MKKILKSLCLWSVLLALALALQLPVYAKAPKTPNTTTSSSDTQLTEKAVLSTPAISSITNTKTGAQITWSKVYGADGYILYRALPADKYYSKLKTFSSASTVSYTDTSAVSGQPYHYTVRAYVTVDGSKTYSGYKSPFVNVFLSRPKKPTLKSSDTGVIISWSKIKGATGYNIYRRLYTENSLTKLGYVSSSYTSCRDRTAVEGKKYAYALRAYVNYNNKTYYSYRYVPESVITYKKPSSGTDSQEEDTSTNSTVYRALLIGECDYVSASIKDLKGPAYDIKVMANALNGMGYKKITSKKNQTKAQILSAIKTAFKDADSNDVSLFYYSGHGCTTQGSSYSGSLIGVDGGYITPAELASALNTLSGKVVVLLDSCGSGATITSTVGSGESQAQDQDQYVDFNNQICQAFQAVDTVITPKYGELTSSSKFNVITSSKAHQVSTESTSGGISYGWFTYGLCRGIGYTYTSSTWNKTLPADTNNNKAVTLEEAYVYTASVVNSLARGSNTSQNVQRYPVGGTLVLFKAE